MNPFRLIPLVRALAVTACLLAAGLAATAAEPPTLQEAFRDHFPVGTAINRNIAMGTSGRRSQELVNSDQALTRAQFNQITAENDMKWQLIHPREGPEGYDFGPADAYAGVFRAFLKHRDVVKMVTFWGVNDAVSWRANGRPLLFDGNNQPKPAFDAVIAEARDGSNSR